MEGEGRVCQRNTGLKWGQKARFAKTGGGVEVKGSGTGGSHDKNVESGT